MKEVQLWLENSEFIAEQAGESFKSKFEIELQLRKKLVLDFKREDSKIEPSQIQGIYRAIGQNPDDPNSCYIGNVKIYLEEGMWKATWNIAGFVHNAYGMLASSNILVFNYSYKDGDGNLRTGIVAYTFFSESIVAGEWIEQGYHSKGKEELRKIDEDEDVSDSHDANLGFSMN